MAQQHFDRLTAVDASFLHQEGADSHMHVGAVDALRGPAAALRRVPRRAARRACTSSRATARSSPSRRSTPAGRCGSTTRASTSSTTSARPRCPARAPRSSCAPDRADLLPAARPLQAAVGDVAGRGPRGRRLRADLQDPPRADRRHRGRRPRAGAVRPRARPADGRRTPARRGSPHREPTPAELLAGGRRGPAARRPRRGAARASARSRARPTALAGAREAAEGIGEIVWAGLNPAPETPLNVEIGPHRRFVGVRSAPRRLQDRQERRSAARSTTSCWPSSPARCATGCTRAACAPRASSCARSCRSRSASRTSTATLGNRIAVMRGPLPVYIEDPVARLRAVARRWTG